LATNTTSGSVILAFKVIFGLTESSEETKTGSRKISSKFSRLHAIYKLLIIVFCYDGYDEINNINNWWVNTNNDY
jgi:hypothetical protein